MIFTSSVLAALLAKAIPAVIGAAGTAYNLISNKRDRDYQKALQQQVFEREDTAVQRRMQDLENAGLNPNLAPGGAASSGAVVARSNTNDVDFGSILDSVSAMQQIQNQKVENKILKNQESITNAEAAAKQVDLYANLGILDGVFYDFDDNDKPLKLYLSNTYNEDGSPNTYNFKYSPIAQRMQYEMLYGNNAADLMAKQNNWYERNQIADIVFNAIGAGTDIMKPSFMKGGRK